MVVAIRMPSIGIVLAWMLYASVATATGQALDIGSERQLFVDRYVIDRMKQVELQRHVPTKLPRPESPLPANRHYMTVLKDEDEAGTLYRAYWRGYDPSYEGDNHSGNPGEVYRYAESRDGHEWEFPNLGIYEIAGSRDNNAVFAQNSPFTANLTPFIDTRPGVNPDERYKALAGYPGPGNKSDLRGKELEGRGLHAFVSPDGIHWQAKGEVISYEAGWSHAFDSQNVSFWSEAEGQYVCYFRTWTSAEGGRLRAISRTTSPDFVTWSKSVPMDQNLEGEHFYTNQTHPYFRAPHIYIALPTRYIAGRVGDEKVDDAMLGSTDILFMTTRAGSEHYDRPFMDAYIRPGLAPERWTNRANYVALNVVPTGPGEMSIYHRSGHRYTLRTDGFMSVRAGFDQGELVTKPMKFTGEALEVNYSTSAAGSLRVEILNMQGKPVQGFSLDESPLLVGDEIDRTIEWPQSLASLEGKPVRLRFVMKECDLYSFRFQ